MFGEFLAQTAPRELALRKSRETYVGTQGISLYFPRYSLSAKNSWLFLYALCL